MLGNKGSLYSLAGTAFISPLTAMSGGQLMLEDDTAATCPRVPAHCPEVITTISRVGVLCCLYKLFMDIMRTLLQRCHDDEVENKRSRVFSQYISLMI